MNQEPTAVPYTADELSGMVSCSTIPEGKLRGVMTHGGSLFTITGAIYGPGESVFMGAALIPAALYQGETFSYQERTNAFRELADEDRQECFYAGVRVHFGGVDYVIDGERFRFTAGEKAAQQAALF